MTVQNKMAVLMMPGGLSDIKSTDRAAASKTQKTDTFNEVFKTADRSYAETDRFEDAKGVHKKAGAEASEDAKSLKPDEREQNLKSVFEKVISEEDETLPENEIVVTDEVMALLQTLISNVSEQLQSILGMSEEQLNLAADELGMTKMDLLNPDSITELVVQTKANGDFTELISNEELHNELSSLLSMLETEVADAAETLGLTEEQFGQLIDEVMLNEDAVTLNISEDIANVNDKQENVLTSEQLDVQETSKPVTVGKTLNEKESQDGTAQNDASQNNNTMFREVVGNLEQNVAAATGTDETQAAQIVRQVVEQIQVRARENMTSMEIQLTPDELGKVNLQVTAKDGAVTAQITTETLAAKEAIEAQISVLRESLSEQGIEIEAVEVTVESHKFEANAENDRNDAQQDTTNTTNTRRRYIDLDGTDEGQLEDAAAVLAREIMMSNGNRMDIVT